MGTGFASLGAGGRLWVPQDGGQGGVPRVAPGWGRWVLWRLGSALGLWCRPGPCPAEAAQLHLWLSQGRCPHWTWLPSEVTGQVHLKRHGLLGPSPREPPGGTDRSRQQAWECGLARSVVCRLFLFPRPSSTTRLPVRLSTAVTLRDKRATHSCCPALTCLLISPCPSSAPAQPWGCPCAILLAAFLTWLREAEGLQGCEYTAGAAGSGEAEGFPGPTGYFGWGFPHPPSPQPSGLLSEGSPCPPVSQGPR